MALSGGGAGALQDKANPLFVQGADADGAAATQNPIKIAGKDESGNLQTLLTDTDGKLQIETTENPLLVLTTGQIVIAVDDTAVPLKLTGQPIKAVIVKALQQNGGREIVVGDIAVTLATGLELSKGDVVTIPIDNLAKVFINGKAPDGVSFLTVL